MEYFVEQLEKKLKGPLPGREAQYRMAHAVRRHEVAPPANAQQAGVLALFYPREGQWHLVFIERQSHHANDRHAGQISFPGGKREAADQSLEWTALREAHEEIGIDTAQVSIIGQLTELYIPVSNFLVYPFVGFSPSKPDFIPQEEEVKAIIEAPFRLFRDPRNIRTADIRIAGNLVLQEVPYFDVFGKILWGATAMMMSELLAILE